MDAKSLCPGGTGKKIKSCCTDLNNELLKIGRMLEGEQRAACLDYIQRLPAEQQTRPCIFALKAATLTEMKEYEQANFTLQSFLETHPGNPVALAYATMIEIQQRNVRAAVDRMQQAIVACETHMPSDVYQAIGLVARVLLAANKIFAARAHLSLQAGLSGEQDRTPIQILAQLDRDTQVPLIQKNDPALVMKCPDDAPYKKDFDAAMRLAARGAWRAAADILLKTVVMHGSVPLLWRNLATLRIYLGEDRAAADALSRYASLDIPAHDKLEAEIYTTVLRGDEVRDFEDVLRLTIEVNDFDRLVEKVLSDKRLASLQLDLRRLARENQPAPRGAYWVFDRVEPPSGAAFALEDVPRVVGTVQLFGRESDREARIELTAVRSAEARGLEVLSEVAGECLGKRLGEEVVGQQGVLDGILGERWRLPPETPPEDQERLMSEQRRRAILEQWPKTPMKLFGGETPTQAARSEHLHPRLAAEILILELSDARYPPAPEFAELREQLKLTPASDLDPATVDFTQLSVLHLHRLDPAQLEDDQLSHCYEHAVSARANRAIRRLGEAVLERASLAQEIGRDEVYADFAETTSVAAEARDFLERACTEAKAMGQPDSTHLLRLLALNLSIADAHAAQEVLNRLKPYLGDDEVAQSVYAILAEFGVIDPRRGPQPMRDERVSSLNVMAGGEAPPPSPSGLWTPDSAAAPAPAGAAKKSGLVLPGMD